MHNDEFYMDMAIQLAMAAKGQTEPNPLVGAIVVKDGEIVGMGAHLKRGEPHAEVHAIAMAKSKSKGASIYVTLEPCSHFGKTPPCAEALINAGIARVVIAAKDPNPLVAGRGIKRLEDAGIEVVIGVREAESLELNEVFNKYIQTKLPFVTVKTAATLDGKTATKTGSSRWITGPEARLEVHRLRHVSKAILVGVQTIINDDPELTTRLPEGQGRNPIRIILDSTLRIPMETRVITDKQAPTWIYTTGQFDPDKKKQLEDRGIRVIRIGDRGDGQIDIQSVLRHLGQEEVSSLLVEGGGTINGSFFKARAIDKVISYIAPKLIGGQLAPTAFGGEGLDEMSQAITLSKVEVKQAGQDICVIGYPVWE